jgi:hypothetical protein
MGRRHELIPLSDRRRWERALAELPHGHAHTWGFCRAIQLTSGLPTYLYRYESQGVRVVCALSERESYGSLDVTTPYGFGGFARSGDWGGFAEDWSEFARQRGWVCSYVALNPVLADADGFPREEVHVHNRLYVMDLRGSDTELWARLSRNRRRQLRDWPALAPALVEDREELRECLLATYADFFARKGAGRATDFRPETMAAIAALDDVLMVGAQTNGRLETVAVFGHTPYGADALFNVSVPGGERHTVHLIWWAVERLRALGIENLNLGGGVRQGDDVAEFKRRFGAAELPLASLRQVFLPDRYAELCRRAGVAPEDRSGYFPPYRAPAAG